MSGRPSACAKPTPYPWKRHGAGAYIPAANEPFAEGLTNAFGTEFFTRTTEFGLDTRRPVFVFGLPRSGTTLIEQILASHSLVHGAGELRLAPRSFRALPAIVGRPGPPLECVPHLDEAAVRRLAEQHLGWLSALDGGRAERIVDKMPGNYTHLGLLATLFPRATFIHCRRDLRDVAVSCWMTDFRMIHWANDPDHIADQFRQYRRLMDHWRSVLPVPIHEVDYEETVADLEGVAPIGRGVRPGVAAGLPGVSQEPEAGSDRQRHAGPPADLWPFGWTLEEL